MLDFLIVCLMKKNLVFSKVDMKFLIHNTLSKFKDFDKVYDFKSFAEKYVALENEAYINVITPKQRHLEGPLIIF